MKELTEKQQVFVYEYITCWNASEAARRAGYKSKANVIGAQLLANPSIKALIDREIKTKAMGADEVLARLSDMARASLDDVLDSDDEFDLNLARATGKIHLVKKFKRTTRTEDNGTTFRTTEIELHDAQTALVQLAKYHKLFSGVEIDIQIQQIANQYSITVDEARAKVEQAAEVLVSSAEFERIMTGKVKKVESES